MASQGIAVPSPPEGAVLLPLRKRGGEIVAWAVIDAEDESRIAAHRWYLRDGYVVRNVPHPDGGRNRHGRMRQTQIGLHRVVVGLKHGDPEKVDHEDHDPLNNRRSNLRVVTHAQNHQNRRGADQNSSSSFRGVAWRKDRGKWQAYACLDGRQYHLGFYADEEEAGRVAATWRAENMPFTTN